MGLEVPRLCDEHCSMCGRFASTLPPDRIREIFQTIGSVPNHAPNWNVAPTQSALVVRRHPDCGERRLDTLAWGLIPSFNKDAKGGRKPINARAETIASFGIFRGAFQARRCIVPIDAFYEWETTSTGKQPYAFARADGTPALAIAGLWESWRDPAGEIRRNLHDRYNGRQRVHEPDPRSDAGSSSSRTPGRLGSGKNRAIRQPCSARRPRTCFAPGRLAGTSTRRGTIGRTSLIRSSCRRRPKTRKRQGLIGA